MQVKKNNSEGDHLTYEQLEAKRHDPYWGHPVMFVGLHAQHWLDTARARHPEDRERMDGLQGRLDHACCERLGGDAGVAVDGAIVVAIVVALEAIVAIMRELAPVLSKPEQEI